MSTRSLRLLGFGIVAVGVLAVQAVAPKAYVAPAGSPLALKQHPRLWLTAGTLPALRTKLGTTMRADYQQFITYLDATYNTAQSDPAYYYHIRNYAFVYAVGPVAGVTYGHPIADYGTKAIALIRQLSADSNTDAVVYEPLAVGYDWCYGLMSASDRISAVNKLLTLPAPLGIGGGGGSFFHHPEDKARTRYIFVGLAFAGDGIQDAAAQTRLDTYSASISSDTGIVPAQNFIASGEGGVSAGASYAVNGNSDGLLMTHIQFMEAWRTANGLSKTPYYADLAELRYYPQWMAYSIMPFSTTTQPAVLYPTHYMNRGVPVNGFADLRVNLSSLRLYNDVDPQTARLAEWLLATHAGRLQNDGFTGMYDAVMGTFLFNPGAVAPASPQDLALPLSKLFRGIGWVAMRSGWLSPSDSVVTFIASPYTRMPAYANMNQGSFTIDRNGPLAINAGGSIHHDYANAAWGSNTMIFPDPNEPPGPWLQYWDRGGQRGLFPVPSGLSQLKPGSPWDIGGIKRVDLYDGTASHDYDYMFADVTRAYNGPANNDGGRYSTLKVASFTRHFIQFRRRTAGGSEFVVVFDRATTVDPKFEKRWLLHPPGREDGSRSFTISGASSTTVGMPIRNGSGAGKTTYMNPALVTVTNTTNGSNGRLFWRPLLPINRRIVEVGGPDPSGKYSTATSHEFEDPYGVQDMSGGSYGPANSQYVGHYTLELQPTVSAVSDVFLNVFEVTLPTQSTMVAAGLLPASVGLSAARIGDRIVTFANTETAVTSASLSISQPGSYRMLLCDLQPGAEYNVGSAFTGTANGSGVLYVPITTTAVDTVVAIRQTGVTTAVPPPVTAPDPTPVPAPVPPQKPAPPTNLRIIK